MLSEHDIKQALRASRVLPVAVTNPHGPFGLEQLAHAVTKLQTTKNGGEKKIVNSIEVSTEAWHKLEQLAEDATHNTDRTVSVSEVAAAILQHYVVGER